jgi:23S rRNA (cytidine1920-2'-O)/16S rRNA (cytidine1409-2'-O)-methyltransferase
MVIAVDAGTNQLHPSLRGNPAIALHEKTDIRNFRPTVTPDIVLIDVSFISLKDVLPHIAEIIGPKTLVAAMAKPQFEAAPRDLSDGVIKNDHIRRDILKAFETWVVQRFVVEAKADSTVPGAKGNRERFYLLRRIDTGR